MTRTAENIAPLQGLGPWPVIIMSACVLGTGYVLSFAAEYDWLSRSAAGLIALLLVLYGLDRRKTGELEQLMKSEIDEALGEMGMKSLEEYPLAGSFTNRYLPILEKARRFQIAEILSASLATMIWGFGDLLVNRTIICGDWTC